MMQKIETAKGKTIFLIDTENDLVSLSRQGAWSRASCPIHGENAYQRSLSINRASGWGKCFECQATVVLAEYNRELAQDLRNKYGAAVQAPGSDASEPESPEAQTPATESEPLDAPEAGSLQDEPAIQQQDEVQALQLLSPWMHIALQHAEVGETWQAQAYLTQRQILELAIQEEVGYLPAELLRYHPDFTRYESLLHRWVERIIFPLKSPVGNGFAGYSIARWQLGMDEPQYRRLLEDEQRAAPQQWITAMPEGCASGIFGTPPVRWPECIVLVGSPLDRLALIAAGMHPTEVQAMVGEIVLDPEWGSTVYAILLALLPPHGAEIETLAEHILLSQEHLIVDIIPPPEGNNDNWYIARSSGGQGQHMIEHLLSIFHRTCIELPTITAFEHFFKSKLALPEDPGNAENAESDQVLSEDL